MKTEAEISTFVDCVFDASDTIELRQLPAAKCSWCTAGELASQVAELTAANEAGQNIYCGANPRTKVGGSKADDVTLARCLFADFDDVDSNAATERIERVGLPKPTLVVNSGHGAHAYWRLNEPVTELAEWTAAQKRLIAALDSDKSIHDRPRIMRLPGFWNVKQDPRVACEVVDADQQRRYSLESLLAVLPEAAPASTKGTTGSADAGLVKVSTVSGGDIPQGERDSTLTSLAGSMRRRGMTEPEIAAALKVTNDNRCKPPLPESDVERIAKSIGSKPSGSEPEKVAAEFEPFPVDQLPDPVRRYILEAAKSIGCDPSFVALPLLAALAGSVGNTRRIRLKSDWAEPCVLWTAIVGDSGTQKTPALSKATTFIAREQETAMAAYLEEERNYKREEQCYLAKLKLWQKKAEGNPPEEPVRPTLQRYIVSDTTVEALASVLQHAQRGLILVRDELAGWLNSFDQYKGGKGGDTAHWLTLYNAQSLTIDRKSGTQNLIHIPIASVSIAGGIQPGILKRSLGQEHWENGLAARLLMSYPPKRQRHWSTATVSAETNSQVAVVFDRLLKFDFATEGQSKVPIDLPLTARGQAAYEAFYNRHAREAADLGGNEAALWSKLEGAAARLALVIHLIRWAAGDSTVASANEVDEVSVATGVTLADWFGAEGRRIYALLAKDSIGGGLAPELRELVEYLESKGGWVTVRELTQGPRRYRGNAELAETHLQQLTLAKIVEWQEVPTGTHGGRPTRQVRLVSIGYGDETNIASAEGGGSVAVATEAVTKHTENVPVTAA